MLRPAAPLALLLALAAGCGGSGGDPDADPAAIAPARAAVYLEATVDPEGETAEDFQALARRVTGEKDPGGALRALLEEKGELDFERDVEPWLGDRLGVFVSSFTTSGAGPDAEVALVAPTDDADAAKKVLERELAERDEGEPAPLLATRKHRDVSYKVDTREDTAVAIVEEYAVTGTQGAVRATIDAAAGEALSETDAFSDARKEVEEDGLGFGYVRVSALLGGLGPQGLAARQLLGGAGETLAFGLDADPDALRVESAALGVRGPASGPGSVLGSLPSSAWMAAGVSDVGGQLDRALAGLGQLGALGGLDVDQILAQVRRQTGIDVREDLIAWMGDAGLFVQGRTVSELGGALVVRSKDPERSARVVPRIGRLLRNVVPGASVEEFDERGVDAGVTLRMEGQELPVHIAAADDRFVIAVSDGALESALSRGGTIGTSPLFRDAAGKLGEGMKPAAFVDLSRVREVLDDAGAFEGEDGAKAREVLERLTVVVAGTRRDGEVQRGRVIVGAR